MARITAVKIVIYCFCSLMIICLPSCSNVKELKYFSNLPDRDRIDLPDLQPTISTIQNDDQLTISISSPVNPEAGLRLNAGGVNSSYLVDIDGNIEFPLIGKIRVSGLTIDEAKRKILKEAEVYAVKPVVNVRYTHFKFTVLGEVKAPGTFTVPNEKVSILEALGYVGDLTQYSSRKQVKIIRDSSGKREIGAINLNDQALFTSPFFYLKRNDVLYVQAAKQKTNADNLARVSAIIATISGIAALTVTLANLR